MTRRDTHLCIISWGCSTVAKALIIVLKRTCQFEEISATGCNECKWQLSVQPVAKTPPEWHFRFIFFIDFSLALITLQLRHGEQDGVSNHQRLYCLFNRLHRSKKTSKFCVTGLCAGNSPGPVNSPHKKPVTRKMFPLDDVIMMNASEPVK